MQVGKEMAKILEDTIWYIARPSIKYTQGIGTYVSYDIAAYDCFSHDIVAITLDVTTNRTTALRIIGKLNRHQLSPSHLNDVILDMLK